MQAEAADAHGETPLHIAAMYGQFEVVKVRQWRWRNVRQWTEWGGRRLTLVDGAAQLHTCSHWRCNACANISAELFLLGPCSSLSTSTVWRLALHKLQCCADTNMFAQTVLVSPRPLQFLIRDHVVAVNPAN